jgi:hypothetical protein
VKRRTALQAVAALAAVWSGVWIVTKLAAAAVPSADRLLAFLGTDPLAGGDRAAVVERIARDYAELPFLEKRALRAPEAGDVFHRFLGQLTPAETAAFVELAMPAGFREMIDGFARLPERDRRRTLDRSRGEVLRHLGDSPARAMLEDVDPALFQRLAAGGLGPMFDALPPAAKLQMLPMIEQVQHNLRQLRD